MKSILDFKDENEYWEYVHTQCTINVTCVLLSKEHWEHYSRIAKEAGRVADAVVDVLRKRK